ncbi:thermonuclease family protein [Roseovarius sp. MBR-78]|jgi:endonuclease YncB( thermonuclease family)|uniref:thermonuclease family protein n=1 Tax=Roseovarius sp. MBR-78 TaxID=3156460 RepID=UPI00339AE47A
MKRRRARRSASKIVVLALFFLVVVLLAGAQVAPHVLDRAGFVDRAERTVTPRALRGGNALSGNALNRAPSVPVSTSGNVVGRVTHVRDGDTIAVAGRPIRFANLDCAETGTLAGTRADRRMRALVSGKTLSCRLTGRKSYDRWIGFCRFPDGRDLASVMVKSGACTWWRG